MASQAARIYKYLAEGGRLTPLQGLELFSTMRLGARIKDLRNEGFNILTNMITTEGGARVAQYYIPREKSVDIPA